VLSPPQATKREAVIKIVNCLKNIVKLLL
jgi:hypothetical protein